MSIIGGCVIAVAASCARIAAISENPDQGADGPAALARASYIDTIGGRQRGSASPGERIDVKRHHSWHIDRLNAWGHLPDRLWAAGVRYRIYYEGATGQPKVTGSYHNLPQVRGTVEPGEWRLHCRDRIAEADGQLPPQERAAVRDVAGHDETIARRLRHLQNGLTILADFWQINVDFCRWPRKRS